MSRPQDRWPNTFSNSFWDDYPYFLPCLVAATFTCVSFIITALYLEEVCYFLLFEEGCTMTSPRHCIQGPQRNSSLQHVFLREKRVMARVWMWQQMNQTNRYHCVLCSRGQSSLRLPITRCSRSSVVYWSRTFRLYGRRRSSMEDLT